MTKEELEIFIELQASIDSLHFQIAKMRVHTEGIGYNDCLAEIDDEISNRKTEYQKMYPEFFKE